MSRKCGRILLRTRMIDEKIRCGVGSPHAAPGFFAGTADKAFGTDAQPAPQVLIFKGIGDFSPTSK